MEIKDKKYLILEFTEFNAQRLNPDSAQMSVHVDDPQLSINAFDKHEDAIRAGISKINSILHSLSNSSGFKSLKSKLALENQKIDSMKVLRITKSNEVNYDVYISFVIGEQEYYGVVEDLFKRNPHFKSEVFKDLDLIQTKEWIIRTKGLIVKTIKKWLRPERGTYKLLNDYVVCFDKETGTRIKLEKGQEVDVLGSTDNTITILYSDRHYDLVNDNFIYFNWWFEKKM